MSKNMTSLSLLLAIMIGCLLTSINGFTPSNSIKRKRPALIGKKASSTFGRIHDDKIGTSTVLYMAKRKKRRKRKQAPSANTDTQSESVPLATPQVPIIPEDDIKALKEMSQSGDKPNLDEIKAIANFQATTTGGIPSDNGVGVVGGESPVELPDIRDALKNKEMKKIEKEEAEKKKQQRKKISRKDTKAFLEVSIGTTTVTFDKLNSEII